MRAIAKPIFSGIDLMPKPTKLTLLRRDRIRAWSVILLVALVLAAVPLGFELLNQHRLRIAVRSNEHRQKLIDEADAALQSIKADAQFKADQLEFSNTLRAKRHWSDLLALVSQSMGEDVWLISMQSATGPDRTPKTTPKPAGSNPTDDVNTVSEVALQGPRSLILEGYAIDHARLYGLMADLRDQGGFLDVDLSHAGVQQYGKEAAVRFRLECRW